MVECWIGKPEVSISNPLEVNFVVQEYFFSSLENLWNKYCQLYVLKLKKLKWFESNFIALQSGENKAENMRVALKAYM